MAANLSRYLKAIEGTTIEDEKKPIPSSTAQPAQQKSRNDAGQTLGNLYGSVQQSSPVTEVNTQEDAAKQAAFVDYQRLQKYLNLADQAQGGGTITAGDRIQAENNYQSRLGDIESLYKKDDTVSAEQQDYWQSLIRDSIDTKLSNMQVDEETGKISGDDWNALWNLYNGKKDKMSDFQQEVMEFYLNNIDHDGGTSPATETIADEMGNTTSGGLVGKEFNGWVIGEEKGRMTVKDADKSKYHNGQIINEANAAHQQVYIYYDGYLYPAVKK